MNLSDLSLRRQITTFMICIAIIMVGVFSLSNLSIDLLPDIEFPTLTVTASYSGASPKEVETLITEPLERAVSTVQNVEEVTSTSSEGSATIRVSFTWGTDMTEAANDLRERIARVKGALPEDATDPMIWKFDASSMPVMFLGFSAEGMPLDEMRDYVENEIIHRLEQIKGVAAANARGGLIREIHIDVDKSQIEAIGLSFDQIVSAIRRENLDKPGGYLETEMTELLLRISGQYTSVDQIANTIVARRNGAPIYLKQIAEVSDSFQETRSETRLKGQPGIFIMIQKQPGQNTVAISDRILKRLKSINESLPEGMDLYVLRDSAEFIRDSIAQVQQVIIIGGALAVLILFLFLRSLRSTLIISVAIPIAVVATFIMMNFSKMTINMMSLGGIALGIGMLLDNSIVVLENIFRHREHGRPGIEAASIGTREVSGAITASTLTTLCVFLPLLFATKGMQGVLFSQLAYTVSFSLLASLFVALTLIPVLGARYLRVDSNPNRRGRGIADALGRAFDRLSARYRDALRWTLHHRVWVVIICPLVLVIVLALVPTLGMELMPQVDEGNISISIQLPVGTKFEITDALARKIEKIVRENVPEMLNMRTTSGSSGRWFAGGGTTHLASIDIDLVGVEERTRSTEEIIADLRRKIGTQPDARIWISSRGSIMTMLLGGRAERLEIDVRGHDLETAATLAEQVREIVESVDGTVNVRVSREEGKPELTVVVDRDKAASLGLSTGMIADIVNTGLTGTIATRYREGGDEYDVRIRYKENDRLTVQDVKDIPIPVGGDASVLLGNVAQIRESKGPISIERRNQQRIITISAGITGRDLGSVSRDVAAKLATIDVPPGFTVQLAGEQEEQREAFRSLLVTLALAVALVYMVMASQFESLLHPFIIMFSIPFAAIGVILILYLTGTNLSIPVFIGAIMLAGIVVNNAIVLVDYINLLRRQGMEINEAILEGGRRRLRPIMMTTLTTVFALIPMSLGLGAGAEMQAPMARTVVGGLTVASLFTLFFIPTLYNLLEAAKRKIRGGVIEQ